MKNLFTFSFKQFFFIFVTFIFIFFILSVIILDKFFYLKNKEYYLENVYKNSKLQNIILGDSQFVFDLYLDNFENLSQYSLSLSDINYRLKNYYSIRSPEKVIIQFSPALLSEYRFKSDFIPIPKASLRYKIKSFYNNEFKFLFHYWKLTLKNIFFDIEIKNNIENLKYERWIDKEFDFRKKMANERALLHKPLFEVYKKKLNEFSETLKYIKIKNNLSQICLVVPPFSEDYLKSFNFYNDIKIFNSFLNEFSKANKVTFLDLSNIFEDNQEYFADTEHLNLNGKEIFSKITYKRCFKN